MKIVKKVVQTIKTYFTHILVTDKTTSKAATIMHAPLINFLKIQKAELNEETIKQQIENKNLQYLVRATLNESSNYIHTMVLEIKDPEATLKRKLEK